MLEFNPNPILTDGRVKTVQLERLESPTILARAKPRSGKRQLLDLRRKRTAKEALAGLTQDNELYGFSKGQFSMLDLLAACLEKTGPAHLALSTWTASR